MAGLNGLMNLGRDSLMTQGYALNVTGQNIANASTPGYVRREAILQTRAVGNQPFGGVEATGIRRMRDQFIDARYYEATGFAFSASARESSLSVVEGLFDDINGTGLGSTLSALFSSFSNLAASPNDPTTRATVMARAQDFVDRAHSTAGNISQLRTDLLSQAQGTAGQASEILGKLASIDQQIAMQVNAGTEPADLKDQEEQLLGKLSELVNIHAFTDGSGRLVVQSSGATLLEGGRANSLSIAAAADGSMQILVNRAGGTTFDITSQVSGGTLAGIRQARDVDAVQVVGQLDRLIFDVATAINTQHLAGYGQDGASGRALFSVAASPGSAATITLDATMVGHPEYLAAASATSNSGNAVVLAGLSSKLICSGGSRTAAQFYSDVVGDVASRKASASREVEVRDAMKAQVQTMKESVSGVSIDEEMVSLSKFQRAYEASSRLIKTADELLAGLIRDL